MSGYVGGSNDYDSKYSALSSKSTVSSFVGEVNKAVQSLTQGAYEDTVKSRFLNKVYNGKYLITGVTIERYSVPIFIGDELVTDPYAEIVKQGAENTPGGLFATVVGNYGLVSDSENDYFVKLTVQFKEL